MGSLSYLDEAGKEDLRISVLSGIISDKLKGRPDEEMLAFTRYGESTYGQYMADYPADEDENMILLNEAGYIEAYFYYFTWLGRYPAKAADIAAFTKLVLREKEEDVLKTYESYPIVISKYYALKSIITDLGFKF